MEEKNDKNDTNDKNVESKETKRDGPVDPILGAKDRRRIVLSMNAEVVRTHDGREERTTTPKAVFTLLDHMNDRPDEGEYEIFLVEDEEKSDIPGPGEERFRRSLFGGPLSKMECMKRLAESYLTPRQCVLEFQRVCTAMAMHSQLKNAMITLVFDGSRPSGFTYFTDSSEQTVSDIEALGNASMRMARGYMSDMKAAHPGQVSFEDDGGIILPNSVDVSKLAKSASEASGLIREGSR